MSFFGILQGCKFTANILNRNASGVLLFNKVLKKNKFELKPNEELSPFEFLYKSKMDATIITEAKRIISERDMKAQKTDKIDKLEKNVEELKNNINKLQKNVDEILNAINAKLC